MMATYDVLRDVLVKEITAYRYRDFATSLMVDIAIQADNEAATITFGHPRRIGCTRYYIVAFGGKSTGLTVECSKSPVLSIERSKSRKPVITDKTRAELHACLDLIERRTNPLDERHVELRQARALRAQQEWWRGNGKTFPLFDLPAELRDSIYSSTWSSVHPYPYHGCRRLNRRYAGELVQPLSLFTVSRQVHIEASANYFRNSTFLIEYMPIWTKLVRNAYFVKNVKRVYIDLSLHDFMFFFNEDDLRRPCPDIVQCLSRRAFRRMSLTHIAVRLPHPRQLTQLVNGTICQTHLITMCITAVWPHVQGQSGIDILGIPAEDQALHAAFEQGCHRARAAYDLWKTNATALGYRQLTLKHYDRWVRFFAEDEDGGVLVGSNESGTVYGWERRCVGNVRCICPSSHEASGNT